MAMPSLSWPQGSPTGGAPVRGILYYRISNPGPNGWWLQISGYDTPFWVPEGWQVSCERDGGDRA